ncbi:hypothetical protein CULT_60033 [[Clostridium] ultunense Esp]|nr:hypothetical protein CULT_60033 [[Clostridium] ultunense Esp]
MIFVLRIIDGLLPIGLLWVTKEIIDNVTLIIKDGASYDLTLIWLLSFQFILTVIMSLTRNAQEIINSKLEISIEYEKKRSILVKDEIL